jgi:hypothetical protein
MYIATQPSCVSFGWFRLTQWHAPFSSPSRSSADWYVPWWIRVPNSHQRRLWWYPTFSFVGEPAWPPIVFCCLFVSTRRHRPTEGKAETPSLPSRPDTIAQERLYLYYLTVAHYSGTISSKFPTTTIKLPSLHHTPHLLFLNRNGLLLSLRVITLPPLGHYTLELFILNRTGLLLSLLHTSHSFFRHKTGPFSPIRHTSNNFSLRRTALLPSSRSLNPRSPMSLVMPQEHAQVDSTGASRAHDLIHSLRVTS